MTRPGITYGGTFWFPEHPLADMHGQVRVICRVQGRIQVARVLQSAGLCVTSTEWLKHHFGESLSHVEQTVTRDHYGVPIACSLSLAYLDTSHYQVIPNGVKHTS